MATIKNSKTVGLGDPWYIDILYKYTLWFEAAMRWWETVVFSAFLLERGSQKKISHRGCIFAMILLAIYSDRFPPSRKTPKGSEK